MFMDVDSEKILTYCRATSVHLDHQLWSNVEPTCLLRQVASDCWLWLRLPLSYRLRRGCGCSTEDQPYAERMVGGWIIFEILHWGPSSRILDREKSMYVIYYNIVHQKNLLNIEANLEQCGPPPMSPTPCQTCLVPELRSPEALILRVDRCCSQPTWRKAAERQRYGELLRAVKSRSWLGRPSGLELRTVEWEDGQIMADLYGFSLMFIDFK